MSVVISDAWRQRFGGTARLYGEKALQLFADVHICVVGIGGVGSWATANTLLTSTRIPQKFWRQAPLPMTSLAATIRTEATWWSMKKRSTAAL